MASTASGSLPDLANLAAYHLGEARLALCAGQARTICDIACSSLRSVKQVSLAKGGGKETTCYFASGHPFKTRPVLLVRHRLFRQPRGDRFNPIRQNVEYTLRTFPIL
jgi:hypothetical protein